MKQPYPKIEKNLKEMMQFNLYHPTRVARRNAKPVYVNGIRYESLFIAGIESGISYVSLALRTKQSKGAPIIIKNKVVCSEKWLIDNPLFFEN